MQARVSSRAAVSSSVLCLLFLSAAAWSAAAAEPSSPSSSTPQEPMAATEPTKVPKYPVSYETPTAVEILTTLDRVRARLEAGTGSPIIDSKTRQPIADLSKPASGAVLDAGPEKKFASYSY